MSSLFSPDFGSLLMAETLDQQAILLRADLDEGDYVAADDPIACHLVPSNLGKSNLRYIAPELRNLGTGTLDVKKTEDVRTKDRVEVSGRLFELVAPATPDSLEWVHRFVVREIQVPERVLYLALKPDGYDGASSDEPLPELVKVLPYAHIEDKPVEVVEQGENDKGVVSQLKQLEVSEIGRDFFAETNLSRLLYCLVVPSNITPTAEQARDRQFPHYRFNGSPSFENFKWGNDYPYRVTLVEER